jgi:hypothetical protein
MTDTRAPSDPPTAFEMLESVLLLISGAVVGAPMLPGFTLCVPVLVLLAVVVLASLVAVAALVTLVVAILAIPYLLVRSIRTIRSHRATPVPARRGAQRGVGSGHDPLTDGRPQEPLRPPAVAA